MSYRFNSGRGGVTCDVCNVLIDQDLSLKEYEEMWGKSGDDGDFCMKCKKGYKNGKRTDSAGSEFDDKFGA